MELQATLLILNVFVEFVASIRVFTSLVPLTEYGDPLSGAHLISAELTPDLKDVTICLRFNYKLLGIPHGLGEGNGRVLTISDWRTNPIVRWIYFMHNIEWSPKKSALFTNQ